MTEASALYRLLSWLSPSYPIGAFSYSHGLETAIEAGFVSDAANLRDWLEDLLRHGAGRSDGLIFKVAFDAATAGDEAALIEATELAAAFQPAAELALESTAQGRAFLEVTKASWPAPILERFEQIFAGPVALPIALALAVAGHGLPRTLGLEGYLHAFAANLVSAGVRLIPLGQTDGQRITAALEPVCLETAAGIEAEAQPLDALSHSTFLGDWCAMRHETQTTRLFRS
jgi:urease accessory protein